MAEYIELNKVEVQTKKKARKKLLIWLFGIDLILVLIYILKLKGVI